MSIISDKCFNLTNINDKEHYTWHSIEYFSSKIHEDCWSILCSLLKDNRYEVCFVRDRVMARAKEQILFKEKSKGFLNRFFN